MKRYYYNDPLAAAWMAKHFGMRFEAPNDPGDSFGWTDGYHPYHKSFCDNVEERGAVVDHDSLHLLEPKAGDLLAYQHDDIEDVSWVGLRPDTNELVVQIDSPAWILPSALHHFKVIYRDGRPFFWPESEEC